MPIFIGGGGPGGASLESDVDDDEEAAGGGVGGFVPGGGVLSSGAAGGGWEVDGASGMSDFWSGCCWAIASPNVRKNNSIASPPVVRSLAIIRPTDAPPRFGIYFRLRLQNSAVCCI